MTTEDKAREALEHLQRAALEMIEAARAVLDVAEELVRDPAPLVAFAASAAHAASSARDGAPGPRVEHIRVS